MVYCYEYLSFKGKFLPLKTPLDDRYNDMIPEFSVFNLDLLFGSLKTMKARNLVLSSQTMKLVRYPNN